jgi:hypothetical protein
VQKSASAAASAASITSDSGACASSVKTLVVSAAEALSQRWLCCDSVNRRALAMAPPAVTASDRLAPPG